MSKIRLNKDQRSELRDEFFEVIKSTGEEWIR
jgi:hypothetical protein